MGIQVQPCCCDPRHIVAAFTPFAFYAGSDALNLADFRNSNGLYQNADRWWNYVSVAGPETMQALSQVGVNGIGRRIYATDMNPALANPLWRVVSFDLDRRMRLATLRTLGLGDALRCIHASVADNKIFTWESNGLLLHNDRAVYSDLTGAGATTIKTVASSNEILNSTIWFDSISQQLFFWKQTLSVGPAFNHKLLAWTLAGAETILESTAGQFVNGSSNIRPVLTGTDDGRLIYVRRPLTGGNGLYSIEIRNTDGTGLSTLVQGTPGQVFHWCQYDAANDLLYYEVVGDAIYRVTLAGTGLRRVESALSKSLQSLVYFQLADGWVDTQTNWWR